MVKKSHINSNSIKEGFHPQQQIRWEAVSREKYDFNTKRGGLSNPEKHLPQKGTNPLGGGGAFVTLL